MRKRIKAGLIKSIMTGCIACGITFSGSIAFAEPAEVTEPDTDTTVSAPASTSSQSGWVSKNGTWYYYKNGSAVTGWLEDKGNWYYLNQNGAMATGWLTLDGQKYYMNNLGKMKTGWALIDNIWYYFNDKGIMQTNWVFVRGKWYFMNNQGQMQTGWMTVGSKKYYLNDSGSMRTGWLYYNNKWYYMSEDGIMQTGWVNVRNKRYYFNADGTMVTGTLTINGVVQNFNDDGAWTGATIPEKVESPSVPYDAAKAINFAKTHTAEDVALGLPRNSCKFGWLCAEFLSNCIKTGGMPEYSDHATILHDKLAKDPNVTEIVVPLDNGYIKLSNVPDGYEIAAGDPILLYCPGCTDGRPFVHSLFFVGWSEDGLAKIYCHNNRNVGVVNRWPYCYACHTKLTEAHVMHINGNSPKKNNTYPANSWMTVGSNRMHIDKNGVKASDWTYIDGNWYYFNRNGIMQTGWQKLEGKWYFFDKNGKMCDGWQKLNGLWYYFSAGVMRTGWITYGGNWYYLDGSGIMATGSKTIGGVTYNFTNTGICTNPN